MRGLSASHGRRRRLTTEPRLRPNSLPRPGPKVARAFLIALGCGALGIGLNNLFVPTALQADSVTQLVGKAYLEQLADFDRHPFLIRSHATMGSLFVLVAVFQFWPAMRRRYRPAHRWIGYAGLALLVALPVTGVISTIVYPFAGLAGVWPNVVWMIAIVYCAVEAFRAARGRDFARHEIWVTRAAGMTVGITLSRLYGPLLVHFAHMETRTMTAVIFWLGQGEGLIAAEIWLRRADGPLAHLARMKARGAT